MAICVNREYYDKFGNFDEDMPRIGFRGDMCSCATKMVIRRRIEV